MKPKPFHKLQLHIKDFKHKALETVFVEIRGTRQIPFVNYKYYHGDMSGVMFDCNTSNIK